jgi:hypothetical protein
MIACAVCAVREFHLHLHLHLVREFHLYIRIRYTVLAQTTLKQLYPFIDLEQNLCFSSFFLKPHFFFFFLVLFCEKSRFFLGFSYGENLGFSRFYFSRKHPQH